MDRPRPPFPLLHCPFPSGDSSQKAEETLQPIIAYNAFHSLACPGLESAMDSSQSFNLTKAKSHQKNHFSTPVANETPRLDGIFRTFGRSSLPLVGMAPSSKCISV